MPKMPSDQISKQKLQQFGNVVPPLKLNLGQLSVNMAGKSQQIQRAK